MMRTTIPALFVFVLMACQPKQNPKAQVQPPHPSMVVWKNYDFKDTTLVHRPEVTEKRFSTFLALLHRTKSEEWDMAVSQLLDTAYRASSVIFRHFTQLADKYLNDPNSPFRNEEMYISSLSYMIEKEGVEEVVKQHARYQLDMAMKNRKGTVAHNFNYLTCDNQQGSLHEVSCELILLFFYNPECDECRRVKEYMMNSSVFSYLQQSDKLKILALYPDEDLLIWKRHLQENPRSWITARFSTMAESEAYHLPAIPALYLLDANKKVLLKDAPIEQIETFLDGM